MLKRAMGRSDEAAALVEEAAALSDVHSAHRGAPAAGAAVSARQQLWLSFSSEATRLTHWSSVATGAARAVPLADAQRPDGAGGVTPPQCSSLGVSHHSLAGAFRRQVGLEGNASPAYMANNRGARFK